MRSRPPTSRIAATLIAAAIITATGLVVAGPLHAATMPSTIVLTDVGQNKRVGTWAVSHKDFRDNARWSVRQRVLHGGQQEGVEVIDVDNGRLSFSVVPTRGMSIHRVDMGAVSLGWKSPVRQLVNPAFINLETRNGLGWLDGFNEWLVRCGVEWAGHPGMDNGRMLTLHGKVGNIPASQVEVKVEKGSGGHTLLRIRGRIDEVSMFGANLELWTEVSTVVGGNTLQIADELRNAGSAPQEAQIIYHANHGAPLLEQGSRLVAAVKELRPLDGVAAKAMDTYDTYAAAVPGFKEEVFGAVLYADAANRTTVVLRNAEADKALAMTYSTEELPFFVLWKNTGAAQDAYVTGLEPATGYPANRSIERAGGRVPVLQPGEKRRFTLDFALLDGKPAVAQAAARVEALQAGRPTAMNPATIKPANP